MMSLQVNASAKTDFEQGAKYFNEGDYNRAVKYFENAYKQGMRNVSLYYNLGSSYFKIKNYQRAELYFKEVANFPEMKSLAEYNLGLIALKLKDTNKARQKFESVIALKQDEKLVLLSKQQLRNMKPEEKPWYAFVNAGIGYDDNITALPDSMVSNVSDMFYELYATGELVLQGERQQGWLADISYMSINYDDTDFYDESQYGVAIKKADKLGRWLTQMELHLDKSTYGGDDFQNMVRFEVSGKRALSKADRLYLKYRYDDINSDNVLYDYLQGWRQILRPEYRVYGAKSISVFYYELELNDRQDLPGASYSPTRHTLRGRYTYRLNDTWHISGDLSWRFSEYEFVTTPVREDDRWRIGAHVDYLFNKTLKLRTKLIHTENESTLDIYDYNKTVVSIGLSKSF
ncbi:MAG TPA: tetratricopeptide repeat protein [Gammaproteobacteria bacterium]